MYFGFSTNEHEVHFNAHIHHTLNNNLIYTKAFVYAYNNNNNNITSEYLSLLYSKTGNHNLACIWNIVYVCSQVRIVYSVPVSKISEPKIDNYWMFCVMLLSFVK